MNQRGPVTFRAPDTTTAQGGAGFTPTDAKHELFTAGVGTFLGEDLFYEGANERADRLADLVREVASTDPEWLAGYIVWLRQEAGIRTAALRLANLFVEHAPRGGGLKRRVVRDVLRRADEPGELVADWTTRNGHLPPVLKRGIADRLPMLYTPRNVIRWDSSKRPVRFADVIRLVHPSPANDNQRVLWHYLVASTNQRPELDAPEGIRNHRWLNALDASQRDVTDPTVAANIERAHWSWEQIGGWLPNGWTPEAWEAVIPNMGVMALIRNLRNFDETGLTPVGERAVLAKLANVEAIRGSLAYPYRFTQAAKAVNSVRWLPALEQAAEIAVGNIPMLRGTTVVLVDQSGSMSDRVSARSEVSRREQAHSMAAAVLMASENPIGYAFANDLVSLPPTKGHSYLGYISKMDVTMGGTNLWGSMATVIERHDPTRLIVFTDEAAGYFGWSGGTEGDVKTVQRWAKPIWTWNFAGYQATSMDRHDGLRVQLAGTNDSAISMIESIERAGENWPFDPMKVAVA